MSEIENYNDSYKDSEEFDFSSLNIAIKVMPSYEFNSNAVFAQRKTDHRLSQMSNTSDFQSALDMDHTFFLVDQTKDIFPTLEFTTASIPVGSSLVMCISVSWSEKGNILSRTLRIQANGWGEKASLLFRT